MKSNTTNTTLNRQKTHQPYLKSYLTKDLTPPTNNNIDLTITTSRSEQILLDYLLTSKKGEVLKENQREGKKLKIGDKTYNYDKTKPLTDRLKRKLTTVKQTMDTKSTNWRQSEVLNGLDWICFQELCECIFRQ